MSWLTKITGVKELIDTQQRTNILLRNIIQLKQEENKKPKGPRTKN